MARAAAPAASRARAGGVAAATRAATASGSSQGSRRMGQMGAGTCLPASLESVVVGVGRVLCVICGAVARRDFDTPEISDGDATKDIWLIFVDNQHQ